MLEHLPERVTIFEMGPRDGLQNEKAFIRTEDKVRLIRALSDAGLPRIEITSFVHPRWVPPLADAPHVVRQVAATCNGGTVYSALVPNWRGLERAIDAGLSDVAVFMSASATHNHRNLNRTHAESFAEFDRIFARCATERLPVRAYVSTAFGCPYEGGVDPAAVARFALRLLDLGAWQISLGDTIGVGNPLQTRRLLESLVAAGVRVDQLALHLHDTRGTALANCLVGLEAGVTTYDTSVGGLGGCPYAPGSSGNLATEDLVFMLEGMGVRTGVDLDRLVHAARLAEALLDRELPSRTLRATVASNAKGGCA